MTAAVYGIDGMILKEEIQEYSEKKLFQRHFRHDKIHRDWNGTEPRPHL
jgi:hypothetical protein